MENIPQPADEPYAEGDRVRIYLAEEDPDAQYHGVVCTIVEDNPDSLGRDTGRDIDNHHYELRRVDTGEKLPVDFRHHDLVPESEWPER